MPRSVTVGRKPAMIICRRLSEVSELPPPGVEWRWARVPVGQGTLQHLRDAGLIVQDSPGTWRTNKKLARFLDEQHDVDLTGQMRVTVF